MRSRSISSAVSAVKYFSLHWSQTPAGTPRITRRPPSLSGNGRVTACSEMSPRHKSHCFGYVLRSSGGGNCIQAIIASKYSVRISATTDARSSFARRPRSDYLPIRGESPLLIGIIPQPKIGTGRRERSPQMSSGSASVSMTVYVCSHESPKSNPNWNSSPSNSGVVGQLDVGRCLLGLRDDQRLKVIEEVHELLN